MRRYAALTAGFARGTSERVTGSVRPHFSSAQGQPQLLAKNGELPPLVYRNPSWMYYCLASPYLAIPVTELKPLLSLVRNQVALDSPLRRAD
jgi:hypothetical protein